MNELSQPIDINEFLSRAGWAGAVLTPMGADMGRRCYSLVEHQGKKALFMDMSRSGYESGLGQYLKIGGYLQQSGVRTPHIYYAEEESGLSLIEYMGQRSFGDALRGGVDKAKLYEMATDILIKIRYASDKNSIKLIGYSETLIRDRLKQFVDYYVPVASDNAPSAAIHESFQAMWGTIEASLPPCPQIFCHADYHLENIMWCPDTPDGYGVIDFQDGFWGAAPYDLLNLLEDARVSVLPEIKTAMKARYLAGMSAAEREGFEAWYDYLSAHFHCRVIGLFVKFSQDTGTQEFLAHIPRLQNYIREHLKKPHLSPLKEWIERHNVNLEITIKDIKQ